MKIAITDANIFIDLIDLELIGHLFRAGLEVHTTYEVLDELFDEQQEILSTYIESKRLVVYLFNDDERDAIGSLDINKGLSETDKALLYLSNQWGALVLTGDGLMRKICKKKSKGSSWYYLVV